MRILIPILFFTSGATALVYEVVWAKLLALMFGSTIQAQTVVLAVFMGGLALGNRLFGGRSDALKSPVKVYGFLELALGVYAFLFIPLYFAADQLFVSLGRSVLDHGGILLAFKGMLSVGLLIVPTVLMGGTLPLLVSWLQRNGTEPGRLSARFYSINSLGAVTGAGLAGFFLVRHLGILASLQAAGLVNALVGGTALLLARRERVSERPPDEAPGEAESRSVKIIGFRWTGWLVGLTGAVSMGLEVLASRSLALIFGSSTQSFSLVLMAFILGIGLGAALIASPRFKSWKSERAIVWLLGAAAIWIGILVFNIESWVEFYRYVRSGLAASGTGYLFHQVFAGAMAMVVLGLPAAFIGAVLPLCIRRVAEVEASLGRAVGRLLAWNTMGAVVGVLGTGFVLMPLFGLRFGFGLAAMTLATMAAVVAWISHWRSGVGWAMAGLGLLALLQGLGGEGWRHVMSSGVYRSRETEVDFTILDKRKKHINILFYQDAADATVTVEQGDGIGAPAALGIRVNGKPDASNQGDLSTQFLLGHLPMAARPESEDVFILGLGSGITAGTVLAYPIERLIVAENCAPIVHAAEYFEPWNRGVLTNPSARIWKEDARTILKLDPQPYDVIVAQPSNPWTSGNGSVFSREFYELAASRLKPGGIMAQWFHIYEMHDQIVYLVLRTFSSVFPYVEIWDCNFGDIIMLGSLEPWESSPERYARAFENPLAKQDLAQIGILSPQALLARQLASQRTAFAIAGDGPIQTDWFPALEYEAPRAFFIGRTATLFRLYDERTVQRDLAPANKRVALSGLSDPMLKPIFEEYTTVNDELLRHLESRFTGGTTRVATPLDPMGLSSSIFSRESDITETPRISEEVSGEIRTLLAACLKLREGTGEEREGLQTFAELMRNRTDTSEWSVPAYAALAVRACIRLEEFQVAEQLLALGLQHAPEDAQLQFLYRVLERLQR